MVCYSYAAAIHFHGTVSPHISYLVYQTYSFFHCAVQEASFDLYGLKENVRQLAKPLYIAFVPGALMWTV
jgi:hypothetical protein